MSDYIYVGVASEWQIQFAVAEIFWKLELKGSSFCLFFFPHKCNYKSVYLQYNRKDLAFLPSVCVQGNISTMNAFRLTLVLLLPPLLFVILWKRSNHQH